jgi:hypothetical protein
VSRSANVNQFARIALPNSPEMPEEHRNHVFPVVPAERLD